MEDNHRYGAIPLVHPHEAAQSTSFFGYAVLVVLIAVILAIVGVVVVTDRVHGQVHKYRPDLEQGLGR